MLRTRHYECPDCNQIFGHTTHLSDEPPPNFCPICGSNMTAPPPTAFVPQAPFLSDRTIGKTADAVYRQHEQASADHAHLAAKIAGGSASDYSAMKVTDMNDRLRPGDVAAKITPNPVSMQMAQSRQGGFNPVMSPVGAVSPQMFAAGTSQGVFPRVGEAMRQEIGSNHHGRARVVQRLGELEPTRRR